MKIKRLLMMFTFILSIFTLAACDDADPLQYTVSIDSNIDIVTPVIIESSVVDGVQSYILTTYEVNGYTFEYWHITSSSEELSTDLSFVYVPSEDVTIEAYYLEIGGEDPDPDPDPVIEDYTITVTTNSASITAAVDSTLTTSGATQYELTAPVTEGFTFQYWIDVDTEQILSSELVYSFVATKDQAIQGIYELAEVPLPTLFYSTEFEDGSKGAYAIGTVTLSSYDWVFNDSLLGSLATDLKVSGKSARIRDGYIQTDFTVTDIAQVTFYAGTYGSDSDNVVNFQISLDKITWITVDSFTSTKTFELYSFVFDEELTTSLGIDTSNAYYLRIESETTARANIDDLKIYTGEGYIADDTPLYVITFTEGMVNQYLLDATVDLSNCVATHPTSGATTCETTGTVDSSVAGTYEITFYKTVILLLLY